MRRQQHAVSEHVAGHIADADDREIVVWMSVPIFTEMPLDDSQAPRAVMAIFLWSYPAEPPEAKASPSQKPYSAETALAMSENVAVPLSAATTSRGHRRHAGTTFCGGTTSATKLSVMSRRPRIIVR